MSEPKPSINISEKGREVFGNFHIERERLKLAFWVDGDRPNCSPITRSEWFS